VIADLSAFIAQTRCPRPRQATVLRSCRASPRPPTGMSRSGVSVRVFSGLQVGLAQGFLARIICSVRPHVVETRSWPRRTGVAAPVHASNGLGWRSPPTRDGPARGRCQHALLRRRAIDSLLEQLSYAAGLCCGRPASCPPDGTDDQSAVTVAADDLPRWRGGCGLWTLYCRGAQEAARRCRLPGRDPVGESSPICR